MSSSATYARDGQPRLSSRWYRGCKKKAPAVALGPFLRSLTVPEHLGCEILSSLIGHISEYPKGGRRDRMDSKFIFFSEEHADSRIKLPAGGSNLVDM